jgi:uncharacterized protein
VSTVIKFLIRAYQLGLSPLLGPRCRFYPSCSQYALEAVQAHGSLRGCLLALRRLSHCHPWHAGGYDPVPLPIHSTRCCEQAQHVHER